jgi:hypothetical protein
MKKLHCLIDVSIHVVLVKHEDGLCDGQSRIAFTRKHEKPKTYLALHSIKIPHIFGFQSPSIWEVREYSTFFSSYLVTNKRLQTPQSTDETQRL